MSVLANPIFSRLRLFCNWDFLLCYIISVSSFCWFRCRTCQYLPSDWLERLLSRLFVSRIYPKTRSKNAFVCFRFTIFVLLRVFPGPMAQPICAESAVKQQPTNQPCESQVLAVKSLLHRLQRLKMHSASSQI